MQRNKRWLRNESKTFKGCESDLLFSNLLDYAELQCNWSQQETCISYEEYDYGKSRTLCFIKLTPPIPIVLVDSPQIEIILYSWYVLMAYRTRDIVKSNIPKQEKSVMKKKMNAYCSRACFICFLSVIRFISPLLLPWLYACSIISYILSVDDVNS